MSQTLSLPAVSLSNPSNGSLSNPSKRRVASAVEASVPRGRERERVDSAFGADGLRGRSFSEGWSGALQGNGAGLLSVPFVGFPSVRSVPSAVNSVSGVLSIPIHLTTDYADFTDTNRRSALGCLRCLL